MFAKSTAAGAPAQTAPSSLYASASSSSSAAASTGALDAIIKRLQSLTAPGAVSKAGFDSDCGVMATVLHKALTGQEVRLQDLSDAAETFEAGVKRLLQELRSSSADQCTLLDIGKGDAAGHRMLLVRAGGAYHLLQSNGPGKFTVNQWMTGLRSHPSFTSPYAKALQEADVTAILTMLTEKNLTSICKMLFNNGNIAKFLTTMPLRYVTHPLDSTAFAAVRSLNAL